LDELEDGSVTTVGVLVFLAAYATAAALPGPGLAALVARVLARGLDGVPAYVMGFVAGDLIWFAAAATGLTAIAAAFEPLVNFIRLAGAAYLLYMAYKLVTAAPMPVGRAEATSAASRPTRNFAAGLTLTLGNPKIIVFFMALLPTVLDLRHLTLDAALLIAGLMAIVLTVILGSYAVLANSTRRFFSSRKAIRALNVGTGAMMAGAAVAIATK
jgi:threonine/homoserine/homoserine lactone efflux protein